MDKDEAQFGLKDDGNKLDMSLLDLRFVAPLVPVFAVGVKRYGYRNWTKEFQDPTRRFNAAMKRHLMAIEEDPLAINEEDGNVYHLAQIAWDALELLYQLTTYPKNEGNGRENLVS